MDQIMINGYEWVRLNDVCDILRHVKKAKKYTGYKDVDEVVDQIARMMFYDEIKAAKTDEEKIAARELPGDFVVCKDLGHKNPNGKRLIFFMEFADGEGRAIDNGDKAMRFKYQSKADEVAKRLGKDWRSINIGIEDSRMSKRLLDAIFGTSEDEEEEEE